MANWPTRGILRDSEGAALASPTVTVYLAGTTTPATIYSDRAGSPLANPFTGDADGEWEFYSAVGIPLKITVTYGTITWEKDWIPVGLDHGDLGGLTDDDHTQYHTDARGDARYLKLDASNDPVTGDLALNQGLVVNDGGGDNDSRFEGDTEVNLLFLDASTDRVGVGTATPRARLDVKTAAQNALILESSDASNLCFAFLANAGLAGVFNSVGVGSLNNNLFLRAGATARVYVVGTTGQVGIATLSPGAQLHVAGDARIDDEVALFGAGSFGGGSKVLFLANASTVPTTDPSGGVIVYTDDVGTNESNLFVRNENGDVTRLTGNTSHLAADANSTSTTLADVALSIPVESGKTYHVVATLVLDTAGTDGIDVRLATTATVTGVMGEAETWGLNLSTPQRGRHTSLPAGLGTTHPTGTHAGHITARITFTTTAAGVIKIQLARLGAAGTATIQAGSLLSLQEVG